MAKLKCSGCGTKFDGKFCPKCGLPAPETPPRKKKWVLPLVIVLIIILLVSCIAGTGDGQPQEEAEPSVQSQSSGTAPADGEEPAPDAFSEPAAAEEKPVLEEVMLYSQDGISVTVKGLEQGFMGPEVSVLIANDTDKNITVSTRYLSVNGFMLDSSGLYTQVAAGKKANDTLPLYQSELNRCSIQTVMDLEFYLHIINSDTYDTIADSALLTLATSASGTAAQEINDQGEEILNEKGIRVVSQGLKRDLFWDGTLVLYLENTGDTTVSVYAENVSVNGFMVSESMWADLRPGTRAVDGMLLLNLEGTEITDISQITDLEFTLRVVNANSWASIITDHPVSLTFD